MNRNFSVGYNSFFINFNSSFMFGILIILIVIFLFLPITSNLKLIANGWQSTIEKIYLFIVDMLKAQVGTQAKIFFPYLFTVFIFILLSNISGMTLFAFTLTSHIMVTFTLGVSTFIGLTILGF
jgi:F-type H+-transporting ATPase subunit a